MSSPVRVAHLVGSTGLYGAERWILALLRYLPRDSVQATLVNLVDAPQHTSNVVRAASERGLHGLDFYTGGRFNPASVFRLAHFVTQRGYHILHSHGYKGDLLALLAASRARTKVISTPHGWSQQAARRLLLYESLDRAMLRFVDYVCPLSPELRDSLMRSGVPSAKIRMIVNAVDLDEVDRIAPVARRPGEAVVGYVGQLIKRKNVACLLTAFRHLTPRWENLRLTIVGDGPLRRDLAASLGPMRLSGRVTFTGYTADALSMLKAFDLVVLPSWEEGIPRTLMEAMAAGVPVIASDIPGNRELIEDQETGLLFPPDDPARLARSIEILLLQPAHAKELARRAQLKVQRQFSAERMAHEYAALYEECLTSCS